MLVAHHRRQLQQGTNITTSPNRRIWSTKLWNNSSTFIKDSLLDCLTQRPRRLSVSQIESDYYIISFGNTFSSSSQTYVLGLVCKIRKNRCISIELWSTKMRNCIDSQDSVKSWLYYSIFLLQHLQCMHKICSQDHIKETTIIQVEYLVFVEAGTWQLCYQLRVFFFYPTEPFWTGVDQESN